MNDITKNGAVTAGCVLIGKLLHDWPAFPNWAIPHCVCVVGAISNVAMNGISASNVIEGALLGAASTGLHQVVNQTRQLDSK